MDCVLPYMGIHSPNTGNMAPYSVVFYADRITPSFFIEIIPRKIKVSEYWEKIGYKPECDIDSPKKRLKSPTIKSSPLMSPLNGNTKSTEPIVID